MPNAWGEIGIDSTFLKSFVLSEFIKFKLRAVNTFDVVSGVIGVILLIYALLEKVWLVFSPSRA